MIRYSFENTRVINNSRDTIKVMLKNTSIVYIDGANIWYAQKYMGWLIDWKKLFNYLKEEFKTEKIIYYAAIKEGDISGESQMVRLRKWGYEVKTKKLKRIVSIESKTGFLFKGNFDVEMAIDIILDTHSVTDEQNVILFSGDSDFGYLLDVLHNKFNKKVIVFSTNKFLSWELRKKADELFLLNKLKDRIFYKDLTKTLKSINIT